MKYIKNGLKVLVDYSIVLLIFVVFLYAVLSIAKDNFYFWLQIYSFIIFLLMVLIIYSDLKKLAIKEKRPQYDLKPYPVKGLIYGLIGFSPVILLELVYMALVFNNEVADRIKHIALNTIMGPLYFIIKIGNETFWGYAAASLAVPAIALLAYLAGYYGIDLGKYLKKQQKNQVKPQSRHTNNYNPPPRKK